MRGWCKGVARCHDGAEGAAAAATAWPDMGTELPADGHLAAGCPAGCRQGGKGAGDALQVYFGVHAVNLLLECMPSTAAAVSSTIDMVWLPEATGCRWLWQVALLSAAVKQYTPGATE